MANTKTVSITASMGEGMRIDSDVRGHAMSIDQPQAKGGTDAGPTPLEYLALSLAGCIGSIARIIAMQKQLSLRGLTVSVSGDIDLDVLLGKNQENRAGFGGFDLEVKLDCDMSRDEQQDFIEEVEARCPVSENLVNATPVKIALAD